MTDSERGQVIRSAADVYEEFFVPALFGQWTERVLDGAGVREGDRLLDVGCGTGVVARAAIERVGMAGRVVGIDPNDGMLTVAQRMKPDVEWDKGVAERLPYERGSFDRLTCQFALMFFTDRRGALSEMARVLDSAGSVAVATWASLDTTPGYAAMVELLDGLFGDEAADALRAPFVLGDPGDLEELMSEAFLDPVVTTHQGTARFDSIEAWVHTDIRGWTLADMIDDEQHEELLGEAERRFTRFTDSDGRVAFPAPALIASAASPSL